MGQSKPAAILKNLIREEEQKILASFRADRRIALLELIRAIDFYFVYSLSLKDEKTRKEWEDNEVKYFSDFGFNTALSLFIGEHCYQGRVPLGPSTKDTQQWAESAIQRSGRLGMCKMTLEFNHFNLGTLTMVSDNEIKYTSQAGKYTGLEAIEREEFDIFHRVADEIDEKARSQLLGKRTEMIERMSRYVKPWREHYIQYKTSPKIDRYYEQLGLFWTRSNFLGADSFPSEAVFGGQSFDLYRSAVMILVGWAWKHLDFCQALREKRPDLELRNIMTIYQHFDILCGFMAAALDVTVEEAAEALSVLTLSPDNKSAHISVPRGYLAPLIQLSEESIIKSIAGILCGSAYFFMLAELQRKYPGDWDRAVNLKEDIFRNELCWCFPGDHIYKAARPVKLKIGNQYVTDIDAAFFDERNGKLGIFQLKWQDTFGDSMRKREAKKLNLLESTNTWIDRVIKWLEGKETDTIMQKLGLDQVTKTKISHVHIFILGRNYSHFSGDTEPDPRAAWGMWPQVLRLLKEAIDSKSYDASDPIGWLDTKLREESPMRKPRPDVEGLEFNIGDYHIVMEPSH